MDCNVQEEEGWLLVYHQTFMSTTRTRCELSPSCQLQNTQKGVGSLTAERGGMGGGGDDQTKFNIQLALRFFR